MTQTVTQTAQPTLRRYKLPTTRESGWALIVIGSDGYFSAVSDHGNYAFIWTHPGMEFRKFLTQLHPDYFHSKITHCRESQVWDEEQVEKNIRARLAEMVAAGRIDQDEADRVWEEVDGNVGSGDALWFQASTFPEGFDVHEGIAAMKPEPWSWTFATRVLPRFQNLLREELAAEEAGMTRVTNVEQVSTSAKPEADE